MRFYLKWIFVIFIMALHAEEIDITQSLRIFQLLPKDSLANPLGINPVVPTNFIALSKSGKPDISEGIFWGPEDVLKAYFKNYESLSEPIFYINLEILKQEYYGVLDIDNIKKQLSQNKEFKNSSIKSEKWGDYPLCRISVEFHKEKFHTAYVGLNGDSGAVLRFTLISPKSDKDQKRSLKLWNDFFQNTKELPEPLLLKAHGQEMHIGHTIVDIANCKFKVIAEKRKSDKKIRFCVIPEDKTSKFTFEEASQGLMGLEWHNSDPIVKIKGMYSVKNEWINMFMTTAVLLKEVDEYTQIPTEQKNIFYREL